jgi:hypothetical protein
MIAVKGLYNGKRIEFLEPLPKKQAQKKFLVVITFLEEKKIPRTTGHAVEKAMSEDQLQSAASYRFPRAKQRRMDELLDKGNAGKLDIKERRELDNLVNEFEERTLQKTLALDAIRKMALGPNKKDTPKVSHGR